MKIAVLHDYADVLRQMPAFGRLTGHQITVHKEPASDAASIVRMAQGADALLLTQQRVSITREIVQQLPDLRFIAQTGGNVYHLDLPALTEHGVVVSALRHSSDQKYPPTGELTWALILGWMRHVPYEAARLQQGHWQSTVGDRVAGKTLGVYAFGRIGSHVARIGRAFGMNVVCWGREESTARARAEGFDVASSREAFFETADILTLHLRGGPATRGLVTAADLARMKPTSLLVNTSRAPIIEDGALVEALKKGRPGFAAIDVYEQEPILHANHPLIGMPNVLCTPHLGYCDRTNYEEIYTSAVDALLAWDAGKPFDVINPEALAKRSG